MAKTKFLFTTDLHGSEQVWRKFLNSARYLGLDAIIMGGDITGKMIVPITNRGDGKWDAYRAGKDYVLSESELAEFESTLRFSGYYPYRTTKANVAAIDADKKRFDALFDEIMSSELERWLELIPDRVPDRVKVIITPGNDDRFCIDEVLKKNSNVLYGEGTVVNLDGVHELVSCGWSNPTPWNSPRECSEEELKRKYEASIEEVEDLEKSIFNFHVPPYDSQIDYAPKLTSDLKVEYEGGKPRLVPVGSKACREMIESYQPLLGLHGHIHESFGFCRLGRTVCLNPGSEYAEGILRAFVIEVENGKIKKQQRLES
ncbi:MAG: metallophosphoesterase [Candidatus Methanofastidiosia archaeon]